MHLTVAPLFWIKRKRKKKKKKKEKGNEKQEINSGENMKNFHTKGINVK